MRFIFTLTTKLSYLGREYPAGADYFHKKLKGAFMNNKDLTDPAEIQKRIDLGDYVCKGRQEGKVGVVARKGVSRIVVGM